MSNNQGQNTNYQGATNVAPKTINDEEIKKRLKEQEDFAKFYKEHLAEAKLKGQTPLAINEFAKQYDFLLAKKWIESLNAEKTTKNSTTSLSKQPGCLAKNPIQHKVKENNVGKYASSGRSEEKDNIDTETQTLTPLKTEGNAAKFASTVPVKSNDISQEFDDSDFEEEPAYLSRKSQAEKTLDDIINAGKKAKASEKYKVGYGKPPKEHQFKKGQSGNPKGRKKKLIPKSLQEAVWLELCETHTVKNANGQAEVLRMYQIIARKLVSAAVTSKDMRAMKILFDNSKFLIYDLLEHMKSMEEKLNPPEEEYSPEENDAMRNYIHKLALDFYRDQ